MNKKVLTLALVLVIAISGVFAADINDPATATLTAIIGDFFEHGFVDDINNPSGYAGTKTIGNAFEINPVFGYGYKTNRNISFVIKMEVSDFINSDVENVSIKIGDVKIGSATPDPDAQNKYTLFTSSGSSDGSVMAEAKEVTVYPLKTAGTDHLGSTVTSTAEYVNDNSIPGSYTSTVTISVATV